jgi:DNA repair protein RadC
VVHDVFVETPGVQDMPAGEQATINAALRVLEARLRQPGAVIDSPWRAREYVAMKLAGREAEGFAVLFLTAQHAVLDFVLMFEGGLTQTAVYPRELVRLAIRLNAGAVVLAHNHPSGDPSPSVADEHLTKTLKAALALIDVRVLDHLVVGRLSVVSMAERGLL